MKNIVRGAIALWFMFTPWSGKAQGFSAEVKFFIEYAGATVEGKFYGFKADFDFDPENPENSSIRASVDASSIETGINLRDNHLRSKSFFHVEEYPRIEMISRNFTAQEDGTFLGEFDLYMKGTTKRVILPFTFTPEGNYNRYVGSFRIDRLDYDIGNRGLFMDREVKISLDISERVTD